MEHTRKWTKLKNTGGATIWVSSKTVGRKIATGWRFILQVRLGALFIRHSVRQVTYTCFGKIPSIQIEKRPRYGQNISGHASARETEAFGGISRFPSLGKRNRPGPRCKRNADFRVTKIHVAKPLAPSSIVLLLAHAINVSIAVIPPIKTGPLIEHSQILVTKRFTRPLVLSLKYPFAHSVIGVAFWLRGPISTPLES